MLFLQQQIFLARLKLTVLVDDMLKQDYNSSVDLCFCVCWEERYAHSNQLIIAFLKGSFLFPWTVAKGN